MGKFIVIEGLDGSGKSTQVQLLADRFRDRGIEVHSFREPGSTALGAKLRELLLDPSIAISEQAQFMLFMAARAALHETINLLIKQPNTVVILDRWAYSSYAYQQFVQLSDWEAITSFASEANWPELAFYLDLPIVQANSRMAGKDRFESKPASFWDLAASRYEKLVDNNYLVKVDASGTIAEVQNRIVKLWNNIPDTQYHL